MYLTLFHYLLTPDVVFSVDIIFAGFSFGCVCISSALLCMCAQKLVSWYICCCCCWWWCWWWWWWCGRISSSRADVLNSRAVQLAGAQKQHTARVRPGGCRRRSSGPPRQWRHYYVIHSQPQQPIVVGVPPWRHTGLVYPGVRAV